MYSEVKERFENQEARKIIARHLVKDYILKKKGVVCPQAEKGGSCGERYIAGNSPGKNNRSLRY